MPIPTNATEFNQQFQSEDSCITFLENIRWPHGFVCPNCSHDDGYRLHSRPLIQCPLCHHQTSVTAGTVFHRTRIPLRVWFFIIYSMSQDKGGASSTRLAAQLGMHQNTVWHIMHKVRHAMGRRDENISLAGFIRWRGQVTRRCGRPMIWICWARLRRRRLGSVVVHRLGGRGTRSLDGRLAGIVDCGAG